MDLRLGLFLRVLNGLEVGVIGCCLLINVNCCYCYYCCYYHNRIGMHSSEFGANWRLHDGNVRLICLSSVNSSFAQY